MTFGKHNSISSLVILAWLILYQPAQAQESCGTDDRHQFLYVNDTAYRSAIDRLEDAIHQRAVSIPVGRVASTMAVVPVVVHIIHRGEAVGSGSNLSNNQVMNAINRMNQRFRGQTGNPPDTEIEFCLATVDPNGCPTNGIIRVDGRVVPGYETGGMRYNGTVGAPEADLKNLSRWPNTSYYNIWTVHDIEGNIAGFAYYPTTFSLDGTVIVASIMANVNSTTLTHELGHGFNLRHTFDGDASGCPIDTNCLLNGDRVCDTPPHRSSQCGTSNPCSSIGIWDNSRRNYLSYCHSTRDRFTQGQSDRMHAALAIFPRNQLLLSNGCGSPTYNLTLSKSNNICANECQGSLRVDAVCNLAFSYLWSNGDTTAQTNNLCNGVYSVTVSLSGQIIRILLDTIQSASPIQYAVQITNASCQPGNDGLLTVSASGGSPFSCQQSQLAIVGTDSLLNSTTEYPNPYGAYYFGARHQILFRANELVSAGVNPGRIDQLAFQIASIHGQTGTVSNTYQNFRIGIKTTQNTVVTGLESQFTTVFNPKTVVINSAGWMNHNFDQPFLWDGNSNLLIEVCFDNSATGRFSLNDPVFYSQTSYNSVIYYRADQGFSCSTPANTFTSGKRPNVRFRTCTTTDPYQIVWSDGVLGSVRQNLSAGSYSFTITDSNACSVTDSAAVNQPSPFQAQFSTQSQVSCFGDSNGVLALSVLGGSPPYHVQWNDGSSSFVRNHLYAGNYTLTITDAALCSEVLTAVVSEPDLLSVSLIETAANRCYGDSMAVLSALPLGGTSPYSFSWSNGQVDSIASPLAAGNYALTLTDALGCIAVASTMVSAPPAIEVQTTISLPCVGVCNGSIDWQVSGGTPPYSSLWNGTIPAGVSLNQICPGEYLLEVSDALGCIQEIGHTFISYQAIDAAWDDVSVCGENCEGILQILSQNGRILQGVVTSAGDTLPLMVEDLCAGVFSFSIFDDQSCRLDTQAIIVKNSNAPLILSISDSLVLCPQDTFFVSAAFPNVAWNNGSTQNPLPIYTPGIYVASATSLDGCELISPELFVSAARIPDNFQIFMTDSATLSVSEPLDQMKWFFNEVEIELCRGLDFCPCIGEGIYRVEGFTDQACAWVTEWNGGKSCASSISHGKQSQTSLAIYPNPTYSDVFLDVAGDFTYEAFDVNGKKLNRFSFEKTKEGIRIQRADQPSGLYVLVVRHPNGNILHALRWIWL